MFIRKACKDYKAQVQLFLASLLLSDFARYFF